MANDDETKVPKDAKAKNKRNEVADELLSRANKALERKKKSKPSKAANLERAAEATAAQAFSLQNEHLNDTLRPVSGSRRIKTL